MDGHVHIINRVYWEKIDPWQAQQGAGWDYGRAFSAGVNCIIDNIGTYGYWNYNYTPKQALRLIETLHRYAEAHSDKMTLARSPVRFNTRPRSRPHCVGGSTRRVVRV